MLVYREMLRQRSAGAPVLLILLEKMLHDGVPAHEYLMVHPLVLHRPRPTRMSGYILFVVAAHYGEGQERSHLLACHILDTPLLRADRAAPPTVYSPRI